MRQKKQSETSEIYLSASSVAILDAAQRLFLDAGYDLVSLEEVGRAAGVSRQTVYNQFGSKEAVFVQVVRRHWKAVRYETDSAFSTIRNLEASPARMLRGFASALLRFVADTDQVALTRLVVAESRRRPWIAQEFYRAGKEPILRAFAGALSAMAARGMINCDRPELAAHQFMGLMQEFVIWPRVMAIGDALAELPPSELVVEEAIAMFLSRYGSRSKARV